MGLGSPWALAVEVPWALGSFGFGGPGLAHEHATLAFWTMSMSRTQAWRVSNAQSASVAFI